MRSAKRRALRRYVTGGRLGKKNLSRSFWVEIVLASFAGLLALITPFFPDLIFSVAAVEWRRTT
jgi:hypothetical protein